MALIKRPHDGKRRAAHHAAEPCRIFKGSPNGDELLHEASSDITISRGVIDKYLAPKRAVIKLSRASRASSLLA
jgi:hypothetical protein